MDIENTSDQQSAREQVGSVVDMLELLLQELQKMGLEKEREITIMVGTQKVYKGSVDGTGKREDLTEKQARTLKDTLDAKQAKGSVRILDQDKKLLFHSKDGVILKNELQPIQKQTEATQPKQEATQPEAKQPETRQSSTQEKPSVKPAPKQPETASAKLDFSKGQIPEDLGVPQLKGVDPKEIAKIDRNLAISWGVALEKVAFINESRRSVGDNNPAISEQVKLLSDARDSIEKQIKEKGYTREQLLGNQSQKADYSQSKDTPSLDHAEQQKESQPVQPEQPEKEAVASQSEQPAQEPVAPQAEQAQAPQPEAPSPEPAQPIEPITSQGEQASDAIGRQNEINQQQPQPEQTQQRDPLEELGQIAITQAEQIAELQTKLSEMSGKLDELTQWKENLTPMKLANEQVGNWINRQRDNMASKIHGLANRLAGTAQQKFEQVQDKVSEKVAEGMDRHHQAVDEVKAQVSEKVGEVRESLENRFEQAKERHNTALGDAGQKAAGAFMSQFIEPTAKVLVEQMERVDAVQIRDDGTKSFEAASVSWNVHPDGSTSLTRKADGQRLSPQNVTASEMKGINDMVQTVDRKYGIQQTQSQSQAQTQSVAPSPAQEMKKVVQKV